MGMTARSIMDPSPTVLHTDSTIATAMQYIMQHRYRNLPVVDGDGRFLGVFGVDCLLRLALPKAVIMEKGLHSVEFVRETLSDIHRRLNKHVDQPISSCMYDQVTTVAPDTPLVETLLVLYRTHTSLPVVEMDSGKLVGVISYFDAGRNILAADI